jgi:hypothetical protein
MYFCFHCEKQQICGGRIGERCVSCYQNRLSLEPFQVFSGLSKGEILVGIK